MHDYGLEKYNYLKCGCYWNERPFKKVTLIKFEYTKNIINVAKIKRHIQGKFVKNSWETVVAFWLVESVKNAFEKRKKTADITRMFSRDLHGTDGNCPAVLTQEELYARLMEELFVKVYEDEEQLIVRLKYTWLFT